MERYRYTGLIKRGREVSLKPILSEAGFDEIEISKKAYADWQSHLEFSARIDVESFDKLEEVLRVVEDRLILPNSDSARPSFFSFGAKRDLDSEGSAK